MPEEATAVQGFDWKQLIEWALYALAASGAASQLDTQVSEKLKAKGGVAGTVLVWIWDKFAGNYMHSKNVKPEPIKAPAVKK